MDRQLNSGGGGLSSVENSVVKGLSYNTGISIHWTSEEQSVFEYLIEKYASNVPLVRYALISQALPGKSIHDIVLRIKWMSEKEKGKNDDIFGTSYKSFYDDNIGRLMKHNDEVLDQIDANFLDQKFRENIDLLSQARVNILTVSNNLLETFYNGMPPFPFMLNQELADSVLPPTSLSKN